MQTYMIINRNQKHKKEPFIPDKIDNIISLANIYLATTRPSILKKENITDVFSAIQLIANKINSNRGNRIISLNKKRN